MLDCVSVLNMRQSDAYTIEHAVPSLELMYRAAYGVFLAGSWDGETAVVVGSGNNGGDGFALACILQQKGYSSRIYTVGNRMSADGAYYAEKARACGVPVFPFVPGCLKGCDRVVDCLLGTGFQGELRDHYRRAIEQINASGIYVISVDINSGMDGDTGLAELAVISDLTVTVGAVKTGLIREAAGMYIKRLVCADIGIVFLRREGEIRTPQEWDLPLEKGLCRYPWPVWLEENVIQVR